MKAPKPKSQISKQPQDISFGIWDLEFYYLDLGTCYLRFYSVIFDELKIMPVEYCRIYSTQDCV
jgi:hypothetical protein